MLQESCANCAQKIQDPKKVVIVDADNDLTFCSEDCLHEFFGPFIEFLEEEHLSRRKTSDIPQDRFQDYEYILPLLLNDPDQVWEDEEAFDGRQPLTYFLGEFLHKGENVFYVAVAYYTEETPAFVFLHFPTQDETLLESYRRGNKIYDSQTSEQGEDLSPSEITELDEFPSRLLEEVTDFRSEEDIDEDEFARFESLFDSTLQDPEELWRVADEEGQGYLIFIRHHEVEDELVAYIVMSTDDEAEEPGKILFSFPTKDAKLVEKLRLGKNILNEEPAV